MEIKKYHINGGVYLVIDPLLGLETVLSKTEAALKGGVSVLQIWNQWQSNQDKGEFIDQVCSLAHAYNIPVLINEEWSWLQNSELDGVHFDSIPQNWNELKQSIPRPFLKGITCGNDSARIQWAIDEQIDYISFCSMFPSSSTDTCDLVSFDVVNQTRAKTSIPIFAAGGITMKNISCLLDLGIDGVAVISEILKDDDPESKSRQFNEAIYTR